jgi:hypothetical protein
MKYNELIPKGTVVKVKMHIKRGGYDYKVRGVSSDYATRNADTTPIYLSVGFTVLTGQYSGRQISGVGGIGLHADGDPYYKKMGDDFVKGILCSGHGVSAYDKSPLAKQLRKLKSFADLDGIEFLARIGILLDVEAEEECNTVSWAVTPDHSYYKNYAELMEHVPPCATHQARAEVRPEVKSEARPEARPKTLRTLLQKTTNKLIATILSTTKEASI